MRILDVGCGTGSGLKGTGVSSSDEIVGVEIQFQRLKKARLNLPTRKFVQAQGEVLPFANEVFDVALYKFALPYMNLPLALKEACRVLTPGGRIYLDLHCFRFTLYELTISFPKPKATLFRLWVMLNGVILHFTGRPASIRGKYESFQTVRGISIALRHAGFGDISVSKRFTISKRFPSLIVQARKLVATSHEAGRVAHQAA